MFDEALTRQGHAPDGFELQYCFPAGASVSTRATNVNPLEQAVILCFLLKHLSYCYLSLSKFCS